MCARQRVIRTKVAAAGVRGGLDMTTTPGGLEPLPYMPARARRSPDGRSPCVDPGHGSRDNGAATTQRAPMNDSRPPPPQRPQNIPSPFDASAPAAIPALTTAQRMAAVTMKTYRALGAKRSAKSGEASRSLNCPGNNVRRAKGFVRVTRIIDSCETTGGGEPRQRPGRGASPF